MHDKPSEEITDLLKAWADGDAQAEARLLPAVYQQLRQLSEAALRRHGDITLQTTDLVHEAYLRLSNQNRVVWADRNHFFALASTMLRRVLLDAARRRLAARRDRRSEVDAAAADTDDAVTALSETRAVELLDLDRALSELAVLDERQARLVELRYFVGLGIAELAEQLGISEATAKRDWLAARAWLYRRLNQSTDG